MDRFKLLKSKEHYSCGDIWLHDNGEGESFIWICSNVKREPYGDQRLILELINMSDKSLPELLRGNKTTASAEYLETSCSWKRVESAIIEVEEHFLNG